VPLGSALRQRPAPTYVLTLPANGPRIKAEIEAAPGRPGDTALTAVLECPDLDVAVAAGFRWAQPDGVVLLSPAAASFGQFRDYRDRGEAFARAMHNIPHEASGITP
jgi:UDP-N-acetylmuramoyl-L-alanine---L-glutamate ligase